jgi:hypothetical protein
VADVEDPDRVAGQDGLAGCHRRPQRLVRRPQPAVVIDTDHPAARDVTGERDHPGAGRPHHRPGRRAEVDTPVARQPGPGRRVEPPQNHRRPVERPPEARYLSDLGWLPLPWRP